MRREEEIVRIIQQKLEGTITPEEVVVLDDWLKIEANKAIYAQYEAIWAHTSSISLKSDDFAPNSAKSWEAIQGQITVDRPKRSLKWSYAVAASIAIILTVFGFNYMFDATANGNIQLVLQANEKDTVTFADGSVAYLFGPCSIDYPAAFANEERTVSMNGLAYFDIEHDEARSFEVLTKNGNVEVLGTSFIVDTRHQRDFTVKCLTGKVRVTAQDGAQETILTRRQKAVYTDLTQQLQVAPFRLADLDLAIPLQNMTFTNEPLGEILKRIEYSYGVSIQLENEHLSDVKYSTSLNDTTIDDFLNELEITLKVDVVETKQATYILKGGNSN